MRTEFIANNLYLEDDYRITKLSDKVKRLFENQIISWQLASDGYKSLRSIQIKKFEFDDFVLEAQFNPGRITSSSAKVDSTSINERPCFLCVKNLPMEQKAVKAIDNYIILVNPFPIFPEHYTLPSINHFPQSIKNEFHSFLLLAKKLCEDYTLFYNGPKCGASAPDHLHFQAGNKGFMKIDKEYDNVIKAFGELVYEDDESKTYVVTGYLRNFFSIESKDTDSLTNMFNLLYTLLSEKSSDESMMNIICTYEENLHTRREKWRVIIFPRSKHRPSYFYEEGKNKILLSPASVDLGGVCILPREEDFSKITKDILLDVFNQVTYSDEKIKYIAGRLFDSLKV